MLTPVELRARPSASSVDESTLFIAMCLKEATSRLSGVPIYTDIYLYTDIYRYIPIWSAPRPQGLHACLFKSM
jgi:hypothetical protein